MRVQSTNNLLYYSNGCLIPGNTVTSTVHMQIMTSLSYAIYVKSLWRDFSVPLPTSNFTPVMGFGGVTRQFYPMVSFFLLVRMQSLT